MYTITMHHKTQAEGWKPVKTLPIDSPLIANQILKALPLPLDGDQNGEIKIKIHSDRGENGTMVITIGYTMYQLNR